MHKQMVKFLLLFIVLITAVPAIAAQNPALDCLEALRRSFTGTTNFTADIVQEKQLSLMNEKLVARGRVCFKKPGLFYMELYSPYASRLLLKDNVLSYKLVNEGVREKLVLPPDQDLKRWIKLLEQPVTSLPRDTDLTAQRQGDLWSLKMLTHGRKGIKALRLVFSTAGIFKSVVIEERNGDRTTIHFENFKRDVGLTEKDFVLE